MTKINIDPNATVTKDQAAALKAAIKRKRARRPCLIVVSGDGAGKMVPLSTDPLYVGRAEGCNLRIEEDGVSRRHASIECAPDGTVKVTDLGSHNGTYVNGQRVETETLRDGDKIQVGDATILKLSFQDDIDEALQRNLYESATRDPLTGARNRRAFTEALEREIAFATRHERPVSILALDVDHFKKINDTHGHPAGDHVLVRLVEVITGTVRTEDLVARVGGEEFAIILRDIPTEGAVECAERIRRSVERASFASSETPIAVTISIGVATFQRQPSETPAVLLDAADRALYDAKHSGRNRVCKAQATP